MFRIVAVGAVACATCLVPSIAMACGGDIDTGVVVRPVISFPNQAQSLFAAAADLDQRAASIDSQAATFVQRASEANIDARAIRVQAASTESATERDQLLQLANQLGTQASLETQTAIDLRRQSTQLREQARIDRLRANQLNAGNGGGTWRGRPMPKSTQARI
ncbi:MAG: hypothetical protein ABI183_17370 [Polyangiaceae bacterium]